MVKYHINPKTGNPGLCRAVKICPFGDITEDHYPTKDAARDGYEIKTKAILSLMEKNRELSDLEKVKFDELTGQLKKVKKEISLTGVTPENLAALEMFEQAVKSQTDVLRDAIYEMRIARRVARHAGLIEPFVPPEEKISINPSNGKVSEKRKYTPNKLSFNEEKNDEVAAQELAAWTQMTLHEAREAIGKYDPKSTLTRDQYVVSLFQQSANNPRRIAFLDLETSGFTPATGEIIEVGIIVMDENGNVVKEVDERYDLKDVDVRKQLGTGNVNIHKIEREMLEGKRTFTDPVVQKELGEILNDRNIAVCAHNAGFERRWLNHYLEGFDDVRSEDSSANLRDGTPAAPVQDTQVISKMFMHQTSNDKLESFSTANGVPYEDSHSAFPDALMTQKAYNKFRSSLQESPLGERPGAPAEKQRV